MNPRLLMALVFVGGVSASGAAVAKDKKSKKVAPTAKVDRTRVIGAPVLDDKSPTGLYVWLEDGAFWVAAVPTHPSAGKKKPAKRGRFKLRVESTAPIQIKQRGDFAVTPGKHRITLEVQVRGESAKGSFETNGNITVSDASRSGAPVPLFLGPLAKPGARTVQIGRF